VYPPKLARSARHVTSRRITSETYFGITREHVCRYERGIYTNLHSTYYPLSVLAVLGEGCQARPELNSSGLFFDLLFTQHEKHTSAKRIFSRRKRRRGLLMKMRSKNRTSQGA
jgi:hypothetical protein